MSVIEITLTAVSLAMDAFAASCAIGAKADGRRKAAVLCGLYFGGFQFVMPLIGFFLAGFISSYVETVGSWIACGVLVAIGAKSLWESFHKDGGGEAKPLAHKTLVVLAVATSIDALAVGLTIRLTGSPIMRDATVIGITAFILSGLGALLGGKLGETFKGNAERFAGVVLIALGIKMLL